MAISVKTALMLAAAAVILLVDFSIAYSQHNNSKRIYNPRIVGGYPTTIKQVPWQAALLDTRHYYSCSGAIVNDRYIVTAAHCLVDKIASNMLIQTGSDHLGDGVLSYVKRIVMHEQYKSAYCTCDIGLIELIEPLEFDSRTAPVDLAYQDQTLYDGDLIQVTGWGHTSEGGDWSDTLQEVMVPVFNQEQCVYAMASYTANIGDDVFCAGYPEGGKDGCQGDSGGGVINNGVLVGIVSWGRGCARPGYYGIYTRMAFFRDWWDANAITYY